jgi:predicted dehydrogenase
MIRVALLGGGFMARIHAQSYAALRDRVQVRVVCALDGAGAIAGDLGADVSHDWEAAVAAPGIDAVDICLPTPLHRAVAVRALAAGRHVLLEKPIALTLEDADAIGAAAEAAGRVLMVGHVLRFFPEVVEMRRLVDSGEFGRPLSATALRLSAPPDWNEWMLDPAKSGGVLVDMMVHDFDILNALLGPARRVHARGSAERRHVQMLLEHEGGSAALEGSHAMPASYPFTAGLRVLCERGVLDHRFVAGAGDEVADAMQSVLGIHPADADARRFHEARDPWAAQIAHFVDCVASGSEPRDGSFAQARLALAVALAARRSAETGAPANVNDLH